MACCCALLHFRVYRVGPQCKALVCGITLKDKLEPELLRPSTVPQHEEMSSWMISVPELCLGVPDTKSWRKAQDRRGDPLTDVGDRVRRCGSLGKATVHPTLDLDGRYSDVKLEVQERFGLKDCSRRMQLQVAEFPMVCIAVRILGVYVHISGGYPTLQMHTWRRREIARAHGNELRRYDMYACSWHGVMHSVG